MPESPKLKVADYLQQWLKEKERQVKPHTAEYYDYYVKNYIASRIGGIRLDKLTPLQIQAMIGDLADTTGVSTANKSRGLLFSALKQAVRWQLIPRNPVEAVDKLKESPGEMRIWSTGEAAHFLDTIQGHRLYAAFYLLMSTGLRCGELLGLRWQDIEGSTIHVKQNLVCVKQRLIIQTPKTYKGQRLIPVSPDVVDVLEQYRQRQEAERQFLGDAWGGADLVFASEVGTPMHHRNFSRTWYELQKKAGVTKVRLHDLRHLHVSLLVKQGMDPRTIADRLGHKDPAFTLRKYSHMFEEQRQAAAISLTVLLAPNQPHVGFN